MEEYEYEDDWVEEEDDDEEEGGWGLSAEEIEKRVLKVNEAQDKRNAEIYRREEDEEEHLEEPEEEPSEELEDEQEDEENKPKSRRGKRSKRQGLKLLLIREYIYNEASKEHPKNATHIRKFLRENYDIEATGRTIRTDIKRLRKDVGVPILYNPHKNGYYIAERQFSIAELRLLVDCIYNADFISRSDADFLTAKILELASRPDREALADKQEEDRKSQTDNSVLKNVEIISTAIERGRKIKFVPLQYVASRTIHTEQYNFTHTVSPKKLTWKLGRCMLEATLHNSHGANINLNYDVALMSDIKILSVPSVFSQPDRTEMPTMEEALDLTYGKKRAITIRFNREVLDEVVRELGEEAILIPVDDNHFEVTIKERVSKFFVNREFLCWVASFGCAAKILAPQDVVDYYLDWSKHENEHIQALYEHDMENHRDIQNIFTAKLAQADDERFIRYVYDI